MPSASWWNAPTASAPSAPAAPTSSLRCPSWWRPRKSRRPRRAAPRGAGALTGGPGVGASVVAPRGHALPRPGHRPVRHALPRCHHWTCPAPAANMDMPLPRGWPTTHMPSPTPGHQWTCPPLAAGDGHFTAMLIAATQRGTCPVVNRRSKGHVQPVDHQNKGHDATVAATRARDMSSGAAKCRDDMSSGAGRGQVGVMTTVPNRSQGTRSRTWSLSSRPRQRACSARHGPWR